jgi:hypothetical protein
MVLSRLKRKQSERPELMRSYRNKRASDVMGTVKKGDKDLGNDSQKSKGYRESNTRSSVRKTLKTEDYDKEARTAIQITYEPEDKDRRRVATIGRKKGEGDRQKS